MAKQPWIRIDLGELKPTDPKQALRAFAPPAPGTTDPTAGPSPAAHGVVVGGVTIDVPDLSAFPTARQKAEHLLGLAAGIEHALLVQYLYAAYSIANATPTPPSRSELVQIALEEMSHLMTVQNVLLLIGARPNLRRADRQDITVDPIVPFDLKFEKLSKAALAKYIVTESPAFKPVADALFTKVLAEAGAAHAAMIQRVGLLYALLGVVLGDEATLATRSATGSEWDTTVKQLADAIAGDAAANAAYGGRAGMHLAAGDFQGAGSPFIARQATDAVWDRSTKEAAFRIFAPTTRGEALDALRDISIQGEAPVAPPAPGEASHFARFFARYKDLYGPNGDGAEPTTGVFDVPTGAALEVKEMDGGPETISNATARPLARLATLRYWILLGALDQYLNSPADDRDFLVAWCMTEMHHLRVLTTALTSRPRTLAGTGQAAIPFLVPVALPSEVAVDAGVPAPARTQWSRVLQEWLKEAITLVDGLLPTVTAPEELRLLQYMRELDQRKLVESTARRSGGTTRTTFDHVREILEWAAGAAAPNLGHGGLGRFWNKPIAELRTLSVGGGAAFGTDSSTSTVVTVLESGFMPRARGTLNTPEHQPKIEAIKAWIDGGTKSDELIPRAGTVSTIRELRLLPTLALARMGSSPTPADNYTLETPVGAGYRKIVPAETLNVNDQDGTITGATTPPAIKFKDAAGRVKPVAPFLEVWARFDDEEDLRPLTTVELGMLGLDASAVRWSVRVANLKVLRRTGQPGDRIAASATFSDHDPHALLGRGPNVRVSQSIPLGSVRYIRPTPAFPEVRLRFTPATGQVFGHAADVNVPTNRAVYDPVSGTWDNFTETQVNPTAPVARARLATAPSGIYATENGANRGYLDDSCDGIVTVSIDVGGQTLAASARVASGPPDYAPDSLPVRTAADDLEQVVLGPDVTDVSAEEVIDIVRRGYETMRAMGVSNENASFPFWVAGAQGAFGPGVTHAAAVSAHAGILSSLQGLLAPPGTPERATAYGALLRVAGAVRAWDEAANYSNPGTTQTPGIRQMPALMRGADGGLLALTRRQRAKLQLAVTKFQPTATPTGPREALVRMIQSLQFGGAFHGSINTAADGPLSSVFANPDKVIDHLENGVVQGTTPEAVARAGERLVQRGSPGTSALLAIVGAPGHTMQPILASYRDSSTGQDGFSVLRDWIASLT